MPVNATEVAAVHEYVRNFDGQTHIRMAILGARDVGKLSLLNCNRFFGDIPDSQEEEDFRLRIEISGKAVCFDGEMLTPPGPAIEWSMVYSLRHSSLRHVEACVLMYDVGNVASFDGLKCFYQDFLAERRLQAQEPCILECLPVCRPRPTPYPGVVSVFANKVDGDPDNWTVPDEDGRAFADSIGAKFASISVKTGEGSGREALEDLTVQILARRIRNEEELQDEDDYAQRTNWIVTRQNARFWY